MQKLELFNSKFYSANTFWADCVRESEIAGLANVIILMYYYLFRWINETNLCLGPFQEQKV